MEAGWEGGGVQGHWPAALLAAAVAHDAARLRVALERIGGAERPHHASVALVLASEAGAPADVSALLLGFGGADVNHQDAEGHTSLFKAAWKEHVGVVADLLTHPGIDANVAELRGKTPLYRAAAYGQYPRTLALDPRTRPSHPRTLAPH